MSDTRWCFPSNSGGDEQGLNNALIETFNDNALKSLAREICQNSLDAALPDKQVIVEFKTFQLSQDAFPCRTELQETMEKCKAFVKGSKNPKTEDFFNKATQVLSAERITFLRISDFNTTGLKGSDKDRGTDWTNLVRSTGSSEKGDAMGGSFGIGKGAPYACSALRTVFYSTLDNEGLMASQGVSRLISFKLGTNPDGSDDIAQGVGYWGVKQEYRILPNRDMLMLDESFKRTESGTDIYIAGLKREIYEDTNELQSIIINEVLDGFIIAIWQGKLEIKVNSFIINKDTLPEIIDKFKSKLSVSTVMNYELLASPTTEWVDIDIEIANNPVGKLKLAFGLRVDGNNKISMIRSSGMKILDKDRLCPTLRFVGLALIEGTALNKHLRNLENPSHNKWEPKRYEPSTSQKLLNTIYDQIKAKLNEYAEKTYSSNVDIEGAGDYLPDDLSGAGDKAKNTVKPEITNKIVNIEKKINKKVDSVASLATDNAGEDLQNDVDSEGNPIEGADDQGYLHDDGHRQNGDQKREPDDVSFEPNTEISGKQIGLVKAKQMRIFCIDKKKQIYRLMFTPTQSSKKGYIAISKIAELSEKEPAKLLSAQSSLPLEIVRNKIGYFTFVEDEQISLDIQIEGQDYASMEVRIYAYKG